MYTKISLFIIVDDDPISNFISKKLILKANLDADVQSFTESVEGLNYVLSTLAKPQEGTAVLLLDINMPALTGWQFMERLETKGSIVDERLLIYILSSSIDPADLSKAKDNPHICDYIMKPLTLEIVKSFDAMCVKRNGDLGLNDIELDTFSL